MIPVLKSRDFFYSLALIESLIILSSCLDDSKTCLSIIVLIIVGAIILLIVYPILHWLAPGIFPSINVK
jgi:uncharacterized membrane protein YjfL (UPF0719 family)